MAKGGFGGWAAIGFLACLGSATGAAPAMRFEQEAREVPFPEGYRTWAHVKSGLLWPETPANAAFSGLYGIYANGEAVTGYTTGVFPEGAVLVFDLFGIVDSDGGLELAGRKAVDVMVRDLSVPGGWRFERFHGGRRADRAAQGLRDACRACHMREADGDGVFSTIVD